MDVRTQAWRSKPLRLAGSHRRWVLNGVHIAETSWRIAAFRLDAVGVGHLCRDHLCRALRRRFPTARWVGLPAVGFAILTLKVLARFVDSGADEGAFPPILNPAAGVCIGAFVIVNRNDTAATRQSTAQLSVQAESAVRARLSGGSVRSPPHASRLHTSLAWTSWAARRRIQGS